MKKISNKIFGTVTLVSIFFASIANAQDNDNYKNAEFGIRLMPTITSLNVKTSSGGAVSGNAVLGFGFGAFLGLNFTKHFGLKAELIYSSLSQKSTDNNEETKINLKYVNIPVLLSFNSGKTKAINLNVVAGPQIGFNVGSSLTNSGNTSGNNPQPVLSVKKNDVGFAYGAGIDFGLNHAHNVRLGFGYRGVLGLIDVSDNSKTMTTDTYYIFDRTHINTNAVYVGLSILF